MFKVNWDDLEWEVVEPGLNRKIVQFDRMTLMLVHFDPQVVAAAHSHPHEQISHVVSGEALYNVDGEEILLRAGDILHLPSGVVHGARSLDGEVEVLDCFTPVREDFTQSKFKKK